MLVTVATCTLNQWSLDFDGNLERIYESCVEARKQGATYRLGPELEICGYGCEDHFYEMDTIEHCWESLIELLERGVTDNGMICDFGMPVVFNGARYNCRVICQNRIVLLIRPKISLADNGNYRESRYFTAYSSDQSIPQQTYILPLEFQTKFSQSTAPFGIQHVIFQDSISIGCETCEELWTPDATHIELGLHGVDIIANGSGSHHELRKLNIRLDLIVNATRKCGGIYLYANQRGCDGGRLYYDGGACIICNGNVLAQAPQFTLDDVQVISATIDINDVRSYRASIPSLGIQASQRLHTTNNRIFSLNTTFTSAEKNKKTLHPTVPIPTDKLKYHCPEEECCLGPACWLWDYLRRSGASGYFLPLSGGADSSSVATIVYIMCSLVYNAIQQNPTGQVAKDYRRICHIPENDNTSDWIPKSVQEITNIILHTTYMGTSNSSTSTHSRASRLGQAIGSYHLSITIDIIIAAVIKVFTITTQRTPQFTIHGGTNTEDLALQNIQARLRMVMAYLFAQLLPWVRGSKSGFLLVLGSANVDEGLRGYMTKYDCSSADLNPIGAISKRDLKKMLLWVSTNYSNMEILHEIATASPSAELRPIDNGNKATDNADEDGTNENDQHNEEYTQLDEEEMGMTYEELGVFGTLRKLSRCGPVSMYQKLCVTWNHLQPSEIASKVKRFFFYYSINRHKMCTITPAYHAEGYSPDDNRFDLRQFLYNAQWPRQFTVIDKLVQQAEGEQNGETTAGTK